LFVQWLCEAREEFFAEDVQAQVLSAFRCGVLNAADGSEDNLIKIQGFEGVYSLDSDSDDLDSDDKSLSNL
jgi:hypothetical protein